MTLKQLEALYAILKTGSITAAAHSLHVTQPAISAALKYAEQRLKMKLFERAGGRLQPTPEAVAMQPELEAIFGRVETLLRTASDLRDGRAGQLVIASSPTLVDALLPRAIAMFRKLSPAVNVMLHSLPTPLAVERVARREADMGIVYAPIADNGVDDESLLVTEIACVVPNGHALARKRQVGPKDLADQTVISLGATTRLGMLINEGCHQAGVPGPPIAIEASSSMAACLIVSAGAGVALVDRLTSLSRKFDDLKFLAFSPRIRVSVRLIYPRQRPRSRATVQFTEQLRRGVDGRRT